MKQKSFATLGQCIGFEKYGRATRKARFLSGMETLVPWAEFCAIIEPHYPKAGNGRPPVGLERMLCMYFIANWFNLADEACVRKRGQVSRFAYFPHAVSYVMRKAR